VIQRAETHLLDFDVISAEEARIAPGKSTLEQKRRHDDYQDQAGTPFERQAFARTLETTQQV
jgi:hypothetical protein